MFKEHVGQNSTAHMNLFSFEPRPLPAPQWPRHCVQIMQGLLEDARLCHRLPYSHSHMLCFVSSQNYFSPSKRVMNRNRDLATSFNIFTSSTWLISSAHSFSHFFALVFKLSSFCSCISSSSPKVKGRAGFSTSTVACTAQWYKMVQINQKCVLWYEGKFPSHFTRLLLFHLA